MADKKKELAEKKAISLIKTLVRIPEGEIKTFPEDEAAEILLNVGYSTEDAWRKIKDELIDLQERYRDGSMFGIPQKRIDYADAMMRGTRVERSEEGILYDKGKKRRSLDQYVGIISAALIGGSSLFLSSNITGNVIWNLPINEINLIGIVMFLVGLFGLFVSLRKK